MSDTVKLIIEIPKAMYENVQNGTYCGTLYKELKNGKPLDNNSAKDILHKAIDNTKIAEDVYPNLRKELHEAVDSVVSNNCKNLSERR